MRDKYIFLNYILGDIEYLQIIKTNPNVVKLYEKYYVYGDLSKTISSDKGKYNEYLSSPLIEILISDPVFSWYIEERVSIKESFTSELMTFMWKMNNNFKALFESESKDMLTSRMTNMFDIVLDFIRDTFPIVISNIYEDENDYVGVTTEHIMRIINSSFKNSLVIKYLILSAICEYAKINPGENIDEDEIKYLIHRFITNGEHD